MILHIELKEDSTTESPTLLRYIKSGDITLAGNKRLKIYGRLDCKSGKRMKMENRVFFKSEAEAISESYRPCGSCMRSAYIKWKSFAV
ncbi:MAG: Ada metal-binding domain-containing protein [Bacteroidota bacterium]